MCLFVLWLSYDLEANKLKKARFEERLDGVIAEAVKRLSGRMKTAYFRGELLEYLKRIGLAAALASEIEDGEFKIIRSGAKKILEERIKRARQKGYLKDYLKQLNMMDILMDTRRIRTVHLWAVPNAKEKTISAPKNAEAASADEKFAPPQLRIVK